MNVVVRSSADGAESVYRAAERYVAAALTGRDSLFTPGRAIWAPAQLADFHDRLVVHADGDPSRTFDEKLEAQMRGASPATCQFVAELLYAHVLVSLSIGGARKRELVNRWLGAPGAASGVPRDLDEALDHGIAATGMAFNLYRHDQLTYLMEFHRAWWAAGDAERSRALADPWEFKRLAHDAPIKRAFVQREALLHLVHPDTFEPIVSRDHKQAIARAFAAQADGAGPDIDRQLLQIRQRLAPQYGPRFSFYEPVLAERWQPQAPSPAPTGDEVVDAGVDLAAAAGIVVPPAPSIFLSHSHEDSTFAERLAHDLRAAGAWVWVDLTDMGAGDFLDRISQGIAACQWLVLVMTPAALRSAAVRAEVNVCIKRVWDERMLGLIPVVASPCDPNAIPPLWETFNRFDATADYAGALSGLLRTLGRSHMTSTTLGG